MRGTHLAHSPAPGVRPPTLSHERALEKQRGEGLQDRPGRDLGVLGASAFWQWFCFPASFLPSLGSVLPVWCPLHTGPASGPGDGLALRWAAWTQEWGQPPGAQTPSGGTVAVTRRNRNSRRGGSSGVRQTLTFRFQMAAPCPEEEALGPDLAPSSARSDTLTQPCPAPRGARGHWPDAHVRRKPEAAFSTDHAPRAPRLEAGLRMPCRLPTLSGSHGKPEQSTGSRAWPGVSGPQRAGPAPGRSFCSGRPSAAQVEPSACEPTLAARARTFLWRQSHVHSTGARGPAGAWTAAAPGWEILTSSGQEGELSVSGDAGSQVCAGPGKPPPVPRAAS